MFDSFAKSTFDGHHSRKFLPEGFLTRLVTEDSIRQELEDRTPQHDPIVVELVPYICSKATKLFATAVYMKCTRKTLLQVMHQLDINDFTDEDLPMQLEDEKSKWAELRWSKDQMEDFYDAQWAFLAPVFSSSQSYYELSSDCILPFLDLEVKDVGIFTLSSLTKGRIHEDHISLTQRMTNDCVAVKRFSRNNKAAGLAWIEELDVHYKFARLEHPHVLCPLAVFRKGCDGYFMYPWANGGNLREFWGQDRRLSLNEDGVTESVVQLRGLCNALDLVYSWFSSPLEDFKPENILVFPEKSTIGNLKICVWGSVRKLFEHPSERHHQTTTRYGARLYEAPEAVTEYGRRLRLCDIWALGCVALEQLVWLLYGEKEHERFIAPLAKADIEGFYRRTGGRPMVKSDVVRWMEHISAQFPPGTGVGDLMEVISTKMLVVDLPPESETGLSDQPINNSYRANTDEIDRLLERILNRLKKDDNYCFSDRPCDGLRGPDDHSAIPVASSSGEPN